MELIFNELSVHGQFADLAAFRTAIDRVMGMRRVMRRFGRELYCQRGLVNSHVTQGTTMPQAVQELDRNSRRALMQWLTRHGPFWEDAREHGEDDYLDCFRYEDRIVTDTAVGEAAFCTLHEIQRGLVSLIPSSWEFSPVPVEFHEDDGVRTIEVLNYWDADELEAHLVDDLLRLLVLQKMRNCFDDRGERTSEGHRLYQKHFTGAKAWFSDSSTSEKNDFEEEPTFRNPSARGDLLFCTWHSKVKWPQLRIHFSWPVRAAEPLYVVYVGPKITKR